MKLLLRSFSFWDIENVKPKFQPRYAYKLYAYKKKSILDVKFDYWLLEKLIFETFLLNLFLNLWRICKNNFRKALFQLPKITWKLKYLTLMLIEWMLLNEFETPIKKGDFNCKTTHKLGQKQFNILSNKYWKFLIYNNPLFATRKFVWISHSPK